MSTPPSAEHARLAHFIEAMDRPLLVLAVVTLGLYMLDLQGLMDSARTPYLALTFLIDVVFVADLALKLRAFGAEYVQTPWFLIDFLSCLPVLDVLASGVFRLRAIRVVRGVRMLRILRGLRVLRALRTIPAFERFVQESPQDARSRRIHFTMNVGVIVLTLIILTLSVFIRKQMERDFLNRIETVLTSTSDEACIRALGGSLDRPPPEATTLERVARVDGVDRPVYFNLRQIDERANAYEFCLILGMMFSMLLFMYIMAYHQLDLTQAQLRGLLHLALPRQVAEQFVIEPGAYNRKSRMPATILFMDFVGFSRTCELLAHDPDRLSLHLEAAMDRVVCELVRHDMIIDKFIGDAVMSFRGGPLVGGALGEHAYRAVRASLESLRALAELKDPYFHEMKIGGASAPDCLIGAFGTSARLSYTILGDGVNLAARLEPACTQCGTRTLFDDATRRLCAPFPDIAWRRWGRIRVEGRSGPLVVYEAFDAAESSDLGFLTTFENALEAFERNEFEVARELFLRAHSERPGGDPPSRKYVAWCDRLLPAGAPAGWEPVFETHK